MYLTFGEIKNSSVADVAGVCVDQPKFRSLVNDATRKFMRRGDFKGTVVPIHTCVYDGCVVWPRYVGQVRKINVCHQPIEVRNFWYNFLPRECVYHWDAPDPWWGTSSWGRWCGESCRSTAYGRTPVFQNIRGEGRLLRAYPRCNSDIGKTITFFGVDNNGQELMTRDADDHYTKGITLTLQKPFASSTQYVRRIDDPVLKDETECPVDVYAYDSANDVLENIAHYDGSETNPEYERSQLHVGCLNGCAALRSVAALVKLRFVPVKNDNDLVLIENLDALKLMVQSQKYSEAGDFEKSRQYELDAIREGNIELRDSMPDDQIPVMIETFNSTGIGRQRVF